jgi:hypothetical protein
MKFKICVAVKEKNRSAQEVLIDTEKLLHSFNINEESGEGYFDSFEIFDCLTEDDFEEKILNEGMIVRAFVTSKGEWVDGPYIYSSGELEGSEKESYDKWVNELKDLLEQHKNCWMFIVSCHS